jgi:hypothetical protein
VLVGLGGRVPASEVILVEETVLVGTVSKLTSWVVTSVVVTCEGVATVLEVPTAWGASGSR